MFNMNTQGIYTFLSNQLYNMALSSSLKDVHVKFGVAIGYSSGKYIEYFTTEELTRYQDLAKMVMQQAELGIVQKGWL